MQNLTERTKRYVTHLVCGVGVACFVGAGCDKVALTAPTDSTIVLYANTTTIGLNGTAEITATVTESAGTPVQNGTVVTFFTSLGTLSPTEARTQNGKATVRLTAASTSGVAIVRAASGGSTTVDPQLEINVGAAAASRVEVLASPSSLPSGGGTVSLVAIVYDTGGNRLAGVPVSFSTTSGSVSPVSATSDNNGEAKSSLTTALDATVTATAASTSDKTLTATASVTVRSAPAVSITVDSSDATAGSPVKFTFSVEAGSSGAAIKSASVDFGDGTRQALSTSGSTPATHVYSRSGTYTVTATATDSTGESTVATAGVSVASASPVAVTLSAGTATSHLATITFTASVSPTGLNVDRYEWTFGDGSTRTTSGTSTSHIYAAAGQYNVTVRVVTTDGRVGTTTIEIILT